jgi:small subunit ribosomal protein S4
MVRYTGPRIKIIRRLGILPGLTRKSSDRLTTPGQHGKPSFGSFSAPNLRDDYKTRLLQKQKLRFNYGVTESQLISYYKEAKRRQGSTGSLLLELLESRLDCIVYRLGFAPSIPAARQLINHGHFQVNQKMVSIPSFLCQPGDLISVKENSKAKSLVRASFESQYQKRALILKRMREINYTSYKSSSLLPNHLQVDPVSFVGKVVSKIQRTNVLVKINELKVIEYYSR